MGWPVGLEAAALMAMRNGEQLLLEAPKESDARVKRWVEECPGEWGLLLREAKPWVPKCEPERLYSGRRLEDCGTASENEICVFRSPGDGTRVCRDLPHYLQRSPSGLSWGYHGAGSWDLAASILLDWTGDIELVQEQTAAFLAAYVSRWPDGTVGDGTWAWTITGAELQLWLDSVHAHDRS